tara:strand:- start:5399 stop:5581 length:183 start_codon:yes stop_codon:yes gene_type:complete
MALSVAIYFFLKNNASYTNLSANLSKMTMSRYAIYLAVMSFFSKIDKNKSGKVKKWKKLK